MSDEFWIGFLYGALAAAIPLVGYMVWDANCRLQKLLNSDQGAPHG